MDQISARLIEWHHQHGRKQLPWQQQRTPYSVWLSEIMLQQTQVVTVIPYFERFCSQFPNISTLAAAPLDSVLALWSGLGYYSRARNLHRSAQIVVEEHQGELPADFEALMALPGIGRSTAGAILAQAFRLPYPILDGNVRRVLCRYHGVEGWPGKSDIQSRLWSLAEHHTPAQKGKDVVDYTQSIMDLGAMICTSRNWCCDQCPIRVDCVANKQDRVALLPSRKPRKQIPQKATVVVALVNEKEELLLERRPPSGIWGGLWSLPEWSPSEQGGSREDELKELGSWVKSKFGVKVSSFKTLATVNHTFTHFKLAIEPLIVRIKASKSDRIMETSALLWYKADQFSRIGLPTPIKKVVGKVYSTVSEER